MTMLKSFYTSRFVFTFYTSSGHVISKPYILTGKDSDMVINKNIWSWMGSLSGIKIWIDWCCFRLSKTWLRDTLGSCSATKDT